MVARYGSFNSAQAGDACLMAVIGPIQAQLRQSDVIGRYGREQLISHADAAVYRAKSGGCNQVQMTATAAA